jgi:glycosyltransferase involved in cell wall biosynthesis
MPLRQAICAVIPCHNEARFIAHVVRGVLAHADSVWVVDDGSTDATAELAAAAGARVIRFPENRGKGTAAAAGLRAALDAGADWAVLLDGDGQHAPEEIPDLLRCAERTGARLVIGNRMARPDGMPLLRRWTNRAMSADLGRWTGHALADTQCGFRALHLPAWERARVAAARFEFESEMLVAFLALGAPVAFEPVSVRYGSERTKIRPLRDTLRWLRWRHGAKRRFTAQASTGAAVPQSPCPPLAAGNILAAK